MAVPDMLCKDSVIIRQWDGLGGPVSPAGLEFVLTKGELFESLVEHYKFRQYLEKIVTPNEIYKDASYWKDEVERTDKLKKDLEGCKIKVTIKVEAEKYVR